MAKNLTQHKSYKQEIEPKKETVKDKIDNVVDEYGENADELKKQIFKLVQRILYPDQFCPECDERMFIDTQSSQYNCPNCGHISQIKINKVVTNVTPINNVVQRPQATGTLPPQVENLIKESENAVRATRRTGIGDQIRKLVDGMDTEPPTAEDDSRVKNSDKNVSSKINWV